MSISVSTGNNVANICESTPVTGGHALLLQKLSRLFPDNNFEHVLTRSGWHRVGGVVTEQGERIADHLPEWLESQDSIEHLLEKYIDSNCIATSLMGKTHYFVLPTGDKADEFIQLEVEELQEVTDHLLISDEFSPGDFEDLIDPVSVQKVEKKPLAEPFYRFRRITDIQDFMKSMSDNSVVAGNAFHNLKRFMEDWEQSSSIEAGGPFCHHWILSFREYTDAWGEKIIQAKPITTFNDSLSLMKLNGVHRGSGLARLIHGFDHDVGYPMAWYFFMLSHREVPHQLAEAIHKDLMGAYDYLPARDLKIIKNWSAKPYSI